MCAPAATVEARLGSTLSKLRAGPRARRACADAALLLELRSVAAAQEQCARAVRDVLAARRRSFPRFYFLSDADLLQALAAAAAVRRPRALRHVPQLLPGTARVFLLADPAAAADDDAGLAGNWRGARRGGGGSSSAPTAAHFAGACGERVDFEAPVPLENGAEGVYHALLTAQRRALDALLARSAARYPLQPRLEWLLQARRAPPGGAGEEEGEGEGEGEEEVERRRAPRREDPEQVMLTVAAAEACHEMEAALSAAAAGDPGALAAHADALAAQLRRTAEALRSELAPRDRRRLGAAAARDAHALEVAAVLRDAAAAGPGDFGWARVPKVRRADGGGGGGGAQLRFEVCGVSLAYGYEYAGDGARLLLTPLADRALAAVALAARWQGGCAAVGGAGAGKTGIVQELAAAAGRCCFLFTCGAATDVSALTNVVRGAAAAGAWACLSAPQRLPRQLQALLAAQLGALFAALRAAAVSAVIDGERVPVAAGCAVFAAVTLRGLDGDDGGSGGGGGARPQPLLPPPLRRALRPVAVHAPDAARVLEAALLAEGFASAAPLAAALGGLLQALRSALGGFAGVDGGAAAWGLRAARAAAAEAGRLRRASLALGRGADAALSADAALARGLRSVCAPQLPPAALPAFLEVLSDFFPAAAAAGAATPGAELDDQELLGAVSVACEAAGLWPDADFVAKLLQLDHLLAARGGAAAVIGAAGAGKSTVWGTLLDARRRSRGAAVSCAVLFPDTLSDEELFGAMVISGSSGADFSGSSSSSGASRSAQWKEGLLTAALRRHATAAAADADAQPSELWLVMDGDADADWLDPLSAALCISSSSGAGALTLASGERLAAPRGAVTLIVEACDLRRASPAAAARLGVVHVPSAGDAPWRRLVAAWVQRQDASEAAKGAAAALFERYVPPLIARCAHGGGGGAGGGDGGCAAAGAASVALLLRLLSALAARPPRERAFAFCAAWAFGGALDAPEARRAFGEWWRAQFGAAALGIPDGGASILDYYLVEEDGPNCKFEVWPEAGAPSALPPLRYDVPPGCVALQTPAAAAAAYWVRASVAARAHVAVAGGGGVGKSLLLRAVLREAREQYAQASLQALGRDTPPDAAYAADAIALHHHTTCGAFRRMLESRLQRAGRAAYAPPRAAASALLVVDDLHLPSGAAAAGAAAAAATADGSAQHPIAAFIAHHADRGFWHDAQRGTCEVAAAGCHYVIASNPALARGGGGSAAAARLARHVLTVALLPPSASALASCFRSLARAALRLHADAAAAFRRGAAAASAHLGPGLRELARVLRGVAAAGGGGGGGGGGGRAPERDAAARRWAQETLRAYGDALPGAAAAARLRGMVAAQAEKASFAEVAARLAGAATAPLVFTHIAVPGREDNKARVVREVDDPRATCAALTLD
ncbi:hydrolytic ATP binding site of dynein motor region D1-domain-containing protein [Tribonema minus]|uniref:Hydrolytic ATP binding site of dynein motor region D1-domain-containing protein n=1 Tax=Tribonema minus TaxID=303371 RepID=A0A835YVG4_9STRA|nr:hydrolytic ATP binding site of dynein motor region D1-domain-containing protein [Tribonema minus]